VPDSQLDREFHKSIVDNIGDGVYFVDPARTILYWNRGAEKLTAYSPDRVEGHRCYENILNHVDAEGNVLCHTVCPWRPRSETARTQRSRSGSGTPTVTARPSESERLRCATPRDE
jgi:PAS domain S-box-containing protein